MEAVLGPVRPTNWRDKGQALVFLSLLSVAFASIEVVPRQMHIALSDSPTSMQVSWATEQATDDSCCQYWLASTSPGRARLTAPGGIEQVCGKQTDFSEKHHQRYLHTVKLTHLKPGHLYHYRCGSAAAAWSDIFWMRAQRAADSFSTENPLTMLVAGDMGVDNSLTLPDIETEVAFAPPDVYLHPGDFAYNMENSHGGVGDDFMNMIQTVAAHVPYMVSPGNHEGADNFTHYRARFHMPMFEETENLYYSFDIGPVHVVSFNTEAFFWPDYYDEDWIARQYAWLEADLQAANARRHVTPWIIAQGHRPMYCAVTHGHPSCDPEYEGSRLGVQTLCTKGRASHCYNVGKRVAFMEGLLHRYGVDLAFFGHKHDYERFLPVFNHTVLHQGVTHRPLAGRRGGANGAPVMSSTYAAPQAPVHVTTGAAGNKQMIVGDVRDINQGLCAHTAPWCYYQAGWYPVENEDRGPFDFSYSRITVFNATHLRLVQWSSRQGRLLDELWIVQHQHGRFPQLAPAALAPHDRIAQV